ncbi:uracil-DNA glycosylase [Haloferax mucosum ATCC BAA-1512]|uniref:Uracil-DNA glycosylase n=1 Tax=Haloferax mucosum ATCC BAA-1512 TaxID=662479 RepID=M0IBQ1_9EURY|nr:uracil-DNA glycosylase [Haloferax mucosum]ELZ94220.1 uracil-DNA glycosylase [Haloferax mucosum ATCC BAA-1512]
MDAHQRQFRNPFSMDTDCTNCTGLCEVREQVVHGYGDVGAEFLFVGESPSAAAEKTGVPFTGDAAGERVQRILGALGFSRSDPDADEPDVQNVFLTCLTRCRHPGRGPTDAEISTCEPFLNAEIRMINPHIIVPVGQAALEALAFDYTTRAVDSFDIDAEHATTIRGRGFELVPMKEPTRQTNAETEAFVEHVRESVFARDYRQTKGRQSR